MSDKETKKTEDEIAELKDEQLDEVVGAGPVPFPDVPTSGGGGKVSTSGAKVDIPASTDDEGGSMKGIASSTSGGDSQAPLSVGDVKVQGKNAT